MAVCSALFYNEIETEMDSQYFVFFLDKSFIFIETEKELAFLSIDYQDFRVFIVGRVVIEIKKEAVLPRTEATVGGSVPNYDRLLDLPL